MVIYLKFEEMGPHKKPGIIYCDKIVSIRKCPIDPEKTVIDTVDGSDILVNRKMDEILNYLHPNYNV
jgi:hypothetical protein